MENLREELIKFCEANKLQTCLVDNYLNPKLEVGKWYWHLDNLLFFVREINGSKCFGYGLWGDDWFNGEYPIHDMNDSDSDIREASKEEVEKALIEEAKRRGFKEGVRFIPLYVDGSEYNNANTFEGDLSYDESENSLDLDCSFRVFANGKWATIIDERQEKIEELERKIEKAQQQIKELRG